MPAQTVSNENTRPTAHRLALAAVAFAIFIETVDTSIVPPALPAMATFFDVEFTRIQWVVLASVLTQASLSLVIGYWGDVAGKKQILLGGLILTGLGNILCAIAPTLNLLIIFRVVQGIGLTMAGALILGIVTETFPTTQRTQAFGFIGLMVSMGIVIGPLAGGLILKLFSWRMIFIFDAFFVVFAIPLAYYYLRSSPGLGEQGFDILGACAFFTSLLTFLLASTLSQQTTAGWSSSLLYILSAVSLLFFVVHELRTTNPLLDLNLFRSGEFSVYLGTRYISFFVFGGVWLLLPFYLETLLHLEPTTVGMLLAIQSTVFGAGAWIGGQLTDRLGRRPLLLTSLVLLAGSYGWMSTLSADLHLTSFICQMVLIGLGSGMLQPPANSIVFSSASQRNLGMVSSLSTVVRIHSRTLGIAVLGGAWVFLTRLAQSDGTIVTTAQIDSFGQVCLMASLIIGGIALVCATETMLRYRDRRHGTTLHTG